MNLSEIFKMQRALDEAIANRNDLNFSKDEESKNKYRRMQIIALLVETAEFANEIQTFKYWKAKKNVDNEKALEEFADLLHFLGSFAYKLNVEPEIEPLIMSNDINEQLGILFSTISSSINSINKYSIGEMLALTLGCAKLLNYSEEEILKWYYIKNKKNYERIKNHY
ncbi:MAG: dUTP diphosphatase [Metamycoplasmataceae bacterium]|uniref:dUTP diphosphatase n=1 Tax=Mycoplasmopsis lipophila TaxID=2117 RepID=UPI00387385FD